MMADDLPGSTETFARSQSVSGFFNELLENPAYGATSTLFTAVAEAYARGVAVQDICDTFGASRTDVAIIVRTAGVERGLDAYTLSAREVARLYALLLAAQLEIESLRRQLEAQR